VSTEEDSDDGPGNPGHITMKLCEAYRETMTAERKAMEDKITFTIKITGAAITIILAILTAGLHFLG